MAKKKKNKKGISEEAHFLELFIASSSSVLALLIKSAFNKKDYSPISVFFPKESRDLSSGDTREL